MFGTTLLTKTHNCDSGIIEFDMLMTNTKGTIGAVFRYKNDMEFYLLEFSSNLIKIRQRTEMGADIIAKTRAWNM